MIVEPSHQQRLSSRYVTLCILSLTYPCGVLRYLVVVSQILTTIRWKKDCCICAEAFLRSSTVEK